MNLPAKLNHIMVITGEPSGDLHAAHLVREIRQIKKTIYFSGIGGTHLDQQNVDLFYHISILSAMGLFEVLKQFKQIKEAFDLVKKKIRFHTPDLIILVDYPGFNLKVAQFAKHHFNSKILYYITPKVWAWKKSRIKKIKKYTDHAALILPFEKQIFKKAGIPSTFVGNPLLDEYPEHLSKPFLQLTCAASEKQPLVIGIFPGSRNAEIKNLLKLLLDAGEQIYRQNQDIRFIISKATSINKQQIENILVHTKNPHLFEIDSSSAKNIFLKSDLVIAASGTVTLEAALSCVPTIIVYKMSPITFRIATYVVKLKYVGLANLIVNDEVMPELLQNNATPDNISKKALFMIDHVDQFQHNLQRVRKLLGKPGAAHRAAHIAIEMLR